MYFYSSSPRQSPSLCAGGKDHFFLRDIDRLFPTARCTGSRIEVLHAIADKIADYSVDAWQADASQVLLPQHGTTCLKPVHGDTRVGALLPSLSQLSSDPATQSHILHMYQAQGEVEKIFKPLPAARIMQFRGEQIFLMRKSFFNV